MSSPRISPARASASSGVAASLMPPALPRPPVSTCALTTTGPPSSSAAARASAAVVASLPSDTGIPKRRNSSLPWCSYRSKAGASVSGTVCEHDRMRRALLVAGIVLLVAGCGPGGETVLLSDEGRAPPQEATLDWHETYGDA